MKHTAVAVMALALAACQAQPTASQAAGPNAEVIRGMYEAFARGDVPAVAAAMAPDIEWNVAESYIYADGNPYRGPDAVVNGPFSRLAADWTDFKLSTGEFIESGDRVVVLGRYTGLHKTTGSKVDAQFAHVWRVEAGKPVSFQQYTDTLQFATAAGVGGRGKARMTASKGSGKRSAKESPAPAGTRKKAAQRTKTRG